MRRLAARLIDWLYLQRDRRDFAAGRPVRPRPGVRAATEAALVEFKRGEETVRRFLFPAYKVWNIAAHFEDIVEGEA